MALSSAVLDGPPETEAIALSEGGHDGLTLACDRFGPGSDPWLLYLHGFGQNRLAWRATGARLAAAGWHGLALDARGHGDSGWAPDGRYSLDDNLDDLTTLLARRARPPILIGASMGGLIGLLAEGERGGLFEALVLVDVTPRWEESGVSRILNFMAAHPQGFDSLEAAQAAIEAYLPHRARKDPERLRGQLRMTSDGRWRWHWDPALLASIGDNGSHHIPRLTAAAARVKAPVLLLSGDLSDVVSQHTIGEFLKLVPQAEHRAIPGATHLVVGDQNLAFTEAIGEWLRDRFPARRSVADPIANDARSPRCSS